MLDLLNGLSVSGEPRAETADRPMPARPMKRRGPATIYFDIETVPDESRLESFRLDPLPTPKPETPFVGCPSVAETIKCGLDKIGFVINEINPPAEWLDALIEADAISEKPREGVKKLVASMLARRADVTAAGDERRKLLSVTPEFCRIVAIGIAKGEDAPESRVVGNVEHGSSPETEKNLLEWFWWSVIPGGPVCGFNVAAFDLPVIFIRSAILGVKPTRLFEMQPWKGDVIDLMKLRFPSGAAKKLKDLARFYGFDVPAGDVDGSQVAPLFAAGKLNEIGEYVRSDVSLTRRLHAFYSGFFCD